jgi:hypothetical protein
VNAGLDCQVLANVLDSGEILAHAANAAALIGGLGLLMAQTRLARVAFTLTIAAWTIGCLAGTRVAIDASLFRAIAADTDGRAPELDESLARLGLRTSSVNRPIADRISGAMRWFRAQVLAFVTEIFALSVGAIFGRLRCLNPVSLLSSPVERNC